MLNFGHIFQGATLRTWLIPAEGPQFANHAELRAHFSGRYLEDLANANQKVMRMQEKVRKLEEKISVLVTKLNKHSEKLTAGKLPAKWHMPSRVEDLFGASRGPMPSADGPGHPRMGWHP